MFKEKLELIMKGRVKFCLRQEGMVAKWTEVDNAIQPEAKEIVSKRLIGNASSIIDTIELYHLGVLVCSRPISNYLISTSTEVEFDAIFDEASFNSFFDEARLKASVLGNFSIVAGLGGVKDNTQSLMVSWLIEIV